MILRIWARKVSEIPRPAASSEVVSSGPALAAERERAVADEPALGGLAGILDADDDGSVIDDLMKLGGKFFR